jgi:hypothetical protein
MGEYITPQNAASRLMYISMCMYIRYTLTLSSSLIWGSEESESISEFCTSGISNILEDFETAASGRRSGSSVGVERSLAQCVAALAATCFANWKHSEEVSSNSYFLAKIMEVTCES